MNNQKGFANIVLIAVIVVLVGAVGYFAFVKKSEPIAEQLTPVSPTPTPNNPTPQPNTETPAVEKDAVDQPAYLIAAYSKNGKNYIDVDYVEWLHGEASIKAQVEDGKCTSVIDCYDYPNGYKRNRNPLVRTFEVSALVSIGVSGEIESTINGTMATDEPLLISFKTLKDTISKMKTNYPYNTPFSQPKEFITIDVKDNIVTEIIEPYQE